MKNIWLLLLDLGWASFDGDRKSAVISLDKYSFPDALKSTENIMVVFMAPWCNKCQKFMPEYGKAAEVLQSETPPMTLAEVDCANEDNVELCIAEGTKGYPHLVLYKNGVNTGDNPTHLRTKENIERFMRTKLSFPSFHIRTVEQFNKFIDHPQGGIIGVFDSTQGDPDKNEADEDPTVYWYKKAYYRIVNAMIDDARFAHITDRKLANTLFTTTVNPEGIWNMLLYHRPLHYKSKFEPHYYLYDNEKLTAGLLRSWVKDKGHGLCPVLSEDQFHAIRPPIVMAYYQVDFLKDPKGTKYWRNRIMKVAVDYPEFQFAVGARKDFEKMILDDLGGNAQWGAKGPKMVIWNKQFDSFRMEIGQNCDPVCDMEPDGSNLRAFIEQYKNDELMPFIKSAEPPADNDGPVKIIVGKEFKDIVLDETKDVLIEFYAPWCGHCKSLEPIWEELGTTLKGDPNIIIAKMDATANHPPKYFQYQGFPTIFWVGMDQKLYPKKYEGSRTVDAFIEFIKNEAKITPLIINGETAGIEDDNEEDEEDDYDYSGDDEDYDDDYDYSGDDYDDSDEEGGGVAEPYDDYEDYAVEDEPENMPIKDEL